jgi:hypothetical protein
MPDARDSGTTREDGSVMAVMRRCERCVGTGSLESSDSTDDGWWDCSTCNGTGKVADRRRPDPRLAGAVDRIAVLELALRDMADDCWPDVESTTRRYIEDAETAIARSGRQ